MVNGIGASQSGYVTIGEHSQAQVTFLADVEKVFAVATKLKKEIPTNSVGSPDERVCRPDVRGVRSALVGRSILPHIHERHADCSYTRMIELSERLLNRGRRHKNRIIIQRKYDVARGEFNTAVALKCRAPSKSKAVMAHLWKLPPYHFLHRLAVAVIHHEDLHWNGLHISRPQEFTKFFDPAAGGNDDGCGNSHI
jgi:hypothetical protein